METKTRGIAIHAYPFKDSGRVLKVFTEAQGMVSILLLSATSRKGRQTLNMFQPMSRLGLVLRPAKGDGLYNLREVWSEQTGGLQALDPVQQCLQMFYAELILRLFRDTEEDPELFEDIWQWLEWSQGLDTLQDMPIRFVLRMSAHFGIKPFLDGGEFFDLREGEFIDERPHHPEFLNQELTLTLKRYLGTEIVQGAPLSDVERSTRRSLLEALVLYLRLHVEHFNGLRSTEVLATVLDA